MLPIPKYRKHSVASPLSTPNVQSLMLQKASSDAFPTSENRAIDTAAVQLEKMNVSESKEPSEQTILSADSQENKAVSNRDIKINANSSSDGAN